MEELLSDYLQIEDMITSNKQLASLIENLFGIDSSAVVLIEDITKHFPYQTYLLHNWSSLNRKLVSASTKDHDDAKQQIKHGNSIDINDKYFYGCLYTSMMLEDERIPEDSPVLISLITCLRVGMLRGGDEFTKDECLKVLLAGFKRVHSRDLMGWDASPDFFFDCLRAIKTMEMGIELMNSLINMLMIYAGKHFDMVNNLSLADNKSPCGVLALACLANLFMKKSEDKQIIMEIMLENMEYLMENNTGLNAFQVSVKQSNFRQMIRQVGGALTSCTDHIIFALLRVAERHPKSKSLVFIINQLPYAVFRQFANVAVRLCNRQYYQPMQMFCFNMLESPYITEEDDESDALELVYRQISESIVWPLQKCEKDPVVETIKLIYAMLQIQNALVRTILLQMTRTLPVMQDLMTYISQYCNVSWNQDHRAMNQLYVSVYCRLLILNRDALKNRQFRQFTSLLLHANPLDLHSCLKDLKALIASDAWHMIEVQSVVVNSLAQVSSQPGPQTIHFLRTLHELIFADLRTGNAIYHLLTLKSPQSDIVLKNMVNSRLITLRDIESVSVLCKHLQAWRLMSDLSIHMDFALSKHILHFTEHLHEMRDKILKDSTIIYITRFFSVVLDRKGKACAKNEKEILMRFAVFLEGSLINRSVPINALPLALLTMRKYHTHFNTPLARLQAMHDEVEKITRRAFQDILKQHGDFTAIRVLMRDVSYFGEIQMVFGDLPQFKIQAATHDATDNCIMYIQNAKREFSPLALIMIKCMTKIAIRQLDLLTLCVNVLGKLMQNNDPKVKEVCIDCLYDVALFRTSSYEVLLPHVYDLLTTNNALNAVTALKMYAKLFAKEHTIPNDWQTFVIALAIANEDVVRFMEPQTLAAFMQKLNPYFETYFIHIMLYCNDICNNEDHILLPEFKEKILTEKLTPERRHHIYCTVIKYFRPECRTKILTYIYKKLGHEYLRPNDCNSMTLDILIVTYEILKSSEYPELSKFYYERTLEKIQKLECYTSKKMGNGINADDILVLVITKLTKLLYNLNEIYKPLMLKLFHVLFALIDWNYHGIFNGIVDEGMNGKFRKCILKFSAFYKENSNLFHFIENSHIEFLSHPISSNCDRI